jgi:methylglutamate dehydrogenase subunit D
VASSELTARSALAGTARLGRYGARAESPPGVTLSERENLAIAHIAARQGKLAEVLDWLSAVTGATAEDSPRCATGDGMVVVGCGPGQWFVFSEGARSATAVARLTDALAGLASVIDHSSGKVVVRVAGPRARDVLAKGCAVDLDTRAFGPGRAAATEIAHIGCQLWQVDETPTFVLVVNRSIAKSFWSWLTASSAEYGYEVVA